MSDFVVSARKYRPSTFTDVVGQSAITTTLSKAIKDNHLAQSFLFCGPRGVGKTTCARILAKTINCENISENIEACDKCESCTSFNEHHSFNIHELDAASNNSVEDIRKINDQVRIPPQIGTHKIYIIDEAHMLSTSAFNAFLKTLEEPPKHAIFILATTEKNKIIPTVLSRCQVYDFKRISIEDIKNYLIKIANKRNLVFEEDALYLIAQKAEGALRDALSIFDRMVSFTQGNLSVSGVANNLNVLDHQTYTSFGKLFFQNDIPGVLTTYDTLLQRGIDSLQFISGLGDHFRNLMLAKDPKTLLLMEVSSSVKEEYTSATATLSSNYILDAIKLINCCEVEYRNCQNKRVHVELYLMQLASLHFNGEKKKNS